jgi:hypothetical protein
VLLATESLVESLFFVHEAALKGPVTGTSGFTSEFAQNGCRDPKGRSLRDFDLNDRLFLHPLSYMVTTKTFEEMPPVARAKAVERITSILNQGSSEEKYAHLTPSRRQTIKEILIATDPVWKKRLQG